MLYDFNVLGYTPNIVVCVLPSLPLFFEMYTKEDTLLDDVHLFIIFWQINDLRVESGAILHVVKMIYILSRPALTVQRTNGYAKDVSLHVHNIKVKQ